MPSYQEAKIEVERLVNHFATLTLKNRKSYNEAATRQEFILPLFDALGWNTRNAREVAPEEKVSRGRVDFAFKLEGIPRFFLETKKIPEDLSDPRWANQAITYSWLKGVTWAVLSDFEEIKIFNAEWQEPIPARAIFKDLYWEKYLDRFDDLMLLSRDAIRDGAIDREAEKVGKKVKKTPVDRKLFEDLATWRHELFRHLRPYNTSWSIEQIDEAVQRILNRLIFIRAVEDRLIEEQRLIPLLREWQSQGHKGDLVRHLSRLFRELDDVYNARLFAAHFSESAESEPAPYIQIIEGLHDLPGGYGFYDFSAIDADVLGTIYEQYLGYVAQDPEATEVVTKWSKRKKQGIYYTPRFVVKYIVQNTLGKMLEEGGLEVALNVKVLDPACGSGSFLLEAFDVLDNFIAHEQGEIPGEDPEADAHRRRLILTNNLYGVDLDAQAVEITKLNLWLRAVGSRERLPTLDNIRQGNSLIDDPEIAGDTAFNWHEQFPEVMGRGGFNVVIGNPPYIRSQSLGDKQREYYKRNYKVATGTYDIYVLFVERAVAFLMSASGKSGFILPNKFFTTDYGEGLRKTLASQQLVERLVDFEDAQVFPDAGTYTSLLFLSKSPVAQSEYAKLGSVYAKSGIKGLEDALMSRSVRFAPITLADDGSSWNLAAGVPGDFLARLLGTHIPLSSLNTHIFQGLKTSADKIYMVRVDGVRGGICNVTNGLGTQFVLEREMLKPVLKGEHVHRHIINHPSDLFIIYPYIVQPNGNARLMSSQELTEQFPRTWDYLNNYRKVLGARDNGVWKERADWFAYARSQNIGTFMGKKFLVPYMAKQLCVALDEDEGLFFVNITTGGYGLRFDTGLHDEAYFLAILNSRLLNWCIQQMTNRFRGGYFAINKQALERLPICTINFDVPNDVERHDFIVDLVRRMLELKRKYDATEAMLEDRRHDLAREIERLDAQIDQLVYELYGLTEEEIAIVEAG